MDADTFRQFGKAAVDMVAEYLEGVRSRPVLPSVEPGYLKKLMPEEAPEDSEHWQDILADFEKIILPGITHWQSPHFHAYYPTACSYPSIVGELLSSGLGIIGFSWMASPACTELEVVMMDWLGKMMHLPEPFLNCSEGPGGGVIQGSASEATLVCLLAAKERTFKRVQAEHPDWDEGFIKGKMVAYSSEHANSSVEKTGLLGSMKMRLLPTDEKCQLRGETLQNAFREDLAQGLIPTYVCATLGTTGTCSFDKIEELGPVCKEFQVWLHIDAAYAGAAFICPEYQHLMAGVELADSFNFNPHKWMLVNFDVSALWVQDSTWLVDAFNVDRIYLKHQKEGNACAPDYRHWQIPLGRRFRSLKLWFTIRAYGIKGIQSHIRGQVKLAEEFENYVVADPRFEVVGERSLGLVCFRLKGPNDLTKSLLDLLTTRKNIYLIAAAVQDIISIRFVITSKTTNSSDVEFAWREIQDQATVILANHSAPGPVDKQKFIGPLKMFDGKTQSKCPLLNKSYFKTAG